MKIFYPTDNLIDRLRLKATISTSTGYGHITEQIRKHLIIAGHSIVPFPEDADIELYVGQPTFKRCPDMQPSVILTMHEATSLPKGWVESINSYSCLVTPSAFCKNNFSLQGVKVPIYIIHLAVPKDRFLFIERDFNVNPFRYICQCVQVTDRKNALLVEHLFLKDKMPSDTELLVKSIPYPNLDGTTFNMWISRQIHWIEANLPFSELQTLLSYACCSVNPSAAEGFGLLAVEHASTGMCVILTNYSGFAEFATAPGFIPLNRYELLTSPNFASSVDAHIEMSELLTKMIWVYEHREEAYQMGKEAAEFVKENFTYEKTVTAITIVLEKLMKEIPKSILPKIEGLDFLIYEERNKILNRDTSLQC